MGGIISVSGSTQKTQNFLRAMQSNELYSGLDALAQRGVSALAAATPKDTGLTAESWGYEIEITNGSVKITWTNTNANEGEHVAVLIQFGHGTGTGGYV